MVEGERRHVVSFSAKGLGRERERECAGASSETSGPRKCAGKMLEQVWDCGE